MLIRILFVTLVISVLNPAHAVQFSYDIMGRLTKIDNKRTESDARVVSYNYDGLTNIISVSEIDEYYNPKKTKLDLTFEPVQNYSSVSIEFGIKNSDLDFTYDLYISKEPSPLLHSKFEHAGSISLDLSSHISPLFVQVVARNKYGQKFISNIKKLVPLDTDEDQLPDHVELSICSDPNNADSDEDGLLDGIEVGSEIGRYLSDPCSSDTDNDGIDDGFEYARGWNLQRFDVAEVNKQGVNHWEEYTKAQSRSAESRGEEINSGDHVLDVTDKEAFAFTGLVPTGKHSMTLMYWVKFKTMGNHYQFSGVHDGQDHRLYVGLDGSQPIAGLGDNLIKGKNDIKVDKWVHLAAVFDKEASQRVLFVNGQEVKRESSAIFKGSSWRSLLFGAAHRAKGASDFQDAQLDGIQVWSRALDSSDVQSYMLTPPQAGESDVLAYYDFSRYRGLWVENLATGEFDMKLSEDNTIKSGSH